MQNLEDDVKKAFKGALLRSFNDRKATIERVFTEDAVFQHLFFCVRGRDKIAGIYHLWNFNNVSLAIEYLRLIPDPLLNVVVVDLLEYCWMWTVPPTAFLGGPIIRLHTVFELEDTPDGKLFSAQYDHTTWLESLFYYNVPIIGEFLREKVRPAVGLAVAALGATSYGMQEALLGPEEKQAAQAMTGLQDPRREVAGMLAALLGPSHTDTMAALTTKYAPNVELYHSLLIVQGRTAFAGVLSFWRTLFVTREVIIRRIVPSKAGDLVLVDAAQAFRPRIWPSFLSPFHIWMHIILTLRDDGASGHKVVARHETHVLWVESVVFANYIYNPLGWFYAEFLRPIIGILMAAAGNFIYSFQEWRHRVPESVRIHGASPTDRFSDTGRQHVETSHS